MNGILSENRKQNKFAKIVINHILNNKKEYFVSVLLFFIGIIISIIFINNINDSQYSQISNYIKDIIIKIQSTDKFNYTRLFKESFLSNFTLIIIIWIASSTIIGIPIVYGNLIFKGFTLGYTISSIINVLGAKNGFLYVLSSMLLHNLISIPLILAASVSGIKLYKSIVKNKERENVKLEFIRHTVFCIIMLLGLIFSSIIEVYISTNLVKFLTYYINF